MTLSEGSLSHSKDSSLREQYLEYVFIGEICQEMWRRGISMDVLRSHTDQSGYDIVLDASGIQRFIQLKSSHLTAKTSQQKVNLKLSDKPNGCVIWAWFDENDLSLSHFLWFGAYVDQPFPDLGERVARHTKANSEGEKAQRQNIRVLNKGDFTKIDSISRLVDRLFNMA